MSDDPILSLLLSEREEFKFAEERRLFYVALTRTKNENILLIPSDVSLFVKEILSENNYLLNSEDKRIKTTNCPYCITGKLVIRDNVTDKNKFLGCSNFPICNQTFKDIDILENQFLCPSCNSGFMTKRSGKYGNFLGCTNYPKCTNTINLQ
jgi:DNA helicase-4